MVQVVFRKVQYNHLHPRHRDALQIYRLTWAIQGRKRKSKVREVVRFLALGLTDVVRWKSSHMYMLSPERHAMCLRAWAKRKAIPSDEKEERGNAR